MTHGIEMTLVTAVVLPLGLDELFTGCLQDMNWLNDQNRSMLVSVQLKFYATFIKGE